MKLLSCYHVGILQRLRESTSCEKFCSISSKLRWKLRNISKFPRMHEQSFWNSSSSTSKEILYFQLNNVTACCNQVDLMFFRLLKLLSARFFRIFCLKAWNIDWNFRCVELLVCRLTEKNCQHNTKRQASIDLETYQRTTHQKQLLRKQLLLHKKFFKKLFIICKK